MTLMLPTTLYGLAGGTGGGRSCRRNKMLQKEKEENDVIQEEHGRKEEK